MPPDTQRLTITNTDWTETDGDPAQPTLTVRDDELEHRLETQGSGRLDAADVDVTFRLQATEDETDDHGVLAISNNVTGDFVVELRTTAARVHDFVQAVRHYADATDADAAYTVRLETDDAELATYDKRTLLVYDQDGVLLRNRSLIPAGIEL